MEQAQQADWSKQMKINGKHYDTFKLGKFEIAEWIQRLLQNKKSIKNEDWKSAQSSKKCLFADLLPYLLGSTRWPDL